MEATTTVTLTHKNTVDMDILLLMIWSLLTCLMNGWWGAMNAGMNSYRSDVFKCELSFSFVALIAGYISSARACTFVFSFEFPMMEMVLSFPSNSSIISWSVICPWSLLLWIISSTLVFSASEHLDVWWLRSQLFETIWMLFLLVKLSLAKYDSRIASKLCTAGQLSCTLFPTQWKPHFPKNTVRATGKSDVASPGGLVSQSLAPPPRVYKVRKRF